MIVIVIIKYHTFKVLLCKEIMQKKSPVRRQQQSIPPAPTFTSSIFGSKAIRASAGAL